MRSWILIGLAVLLASVVGCEETLTDPEPGASERNRKLRADLEEERGRCAVLEREFAATRRELEILRKARRTPRVHPPEPPTVDGWITGTDEDLNIVLVSVGEDDGLEPGHSMIVHRGDRYVGRFVIDMVGADWSTGQMDLTVTKGYPRKGDRAATPE